MNLSTFLTKNLEPILEEWDKFAATLVPGDHCLDQTVLRDHGKKMLQAIALDLSKPETAKQRAEKSKGEADDDQHSSAATIHGVDRLTLGFTLNSAVAEYRALRASVIRLWQEEMKKSGASIQSFEDLIRFNEALDQAISESVTSYSAEKDQQARIFNTILSSSPDLSLTLSPAGKITYGNRALLEFLQLSAEQIQGKTWTDLLPVAGADLQKHVRTVVKSKLKLHAEIALTSQAGKSFIFDCIVVPVLTPEQTLEMVASTMRDVTDRKTADDKNWLKANHDELTGLPNRSLFQDRLAQAVLHAGRTGTETALFFIDLDRFKEANDSFGHAVGDLLLKFAADRIHTCVREGDTVARLGGDEFTVILHNVANLEHIRSVAEKIVKELAAPFRIFEHSIQISASVGVSLSPQDAKTPQSLMSNADLAMYAAKRAGRDQVVFFSDELLGTPGESTFGRI